MGVWSRLFGKKPQAPKVAATRGHRGIAAGDLTARQEAAQRFYQTGDRADQPYTAEEVAQWQDLGVGQVEAFLHGGQPLFVHSSNVAMAQYFPDEQKMMVEFHGGAAYMYSGVSPQEALSFAQAESKGGWVWSNFRQRGSATASRKPYTRVR